MVMLLSAQLWVMWRGNMPVRIPIIADAFQDVNTVYISETTLFANGAQVLW